MPIASCKLGYRWRYDIIVFKRLRFGFPHENTRLVFLFFIQKAIVKQKKV